MSTKQTEALKLALDWYDSGNENPDDFANMIKQVIALAQQPAQGCDYCNHPQYVGTKCKNCGREQPAQQGCMRCNTPKKCALYGCSPLTWPTEPPAQPQQEPVATVESVATVVSESGNQEVTMSWWHEPALPVGTKLYTTPPQRKPLTDEEIWDEVKAADLDWQTGWSLDEDASNRYITFARAIEAAHGIKEKRND